MYFSQKSIHKKKLHIYITAPDYSREEWLSIKNTLGLAFPNVGITWIFEKYDLSLFLRWVIILLSIIYFMHWFKIHCFLFKIPYYIDDDIKITQSNSILRYIGDKHDVCKYLLLWPLILNRDNLMYNTL